MELDYAINLLRNAVKNAGTIDQKHIDLSIIPTEERDRYQKALIISQLAVKDGKISRDELNRRLNLD